MELSWTMKLRIAAAAAAGIFLIGILGWPLARPDDPFAAVSLTAGSIGLGGGVILAALAFLVGFIAYFLSWPYGREIGILAVPSGIAIWAVRSGSMANLLQLNPALAQRQALFAALKWEPIFWLAIVAAGFVGVLAGQRTVGQKIESNKTDKKQNKCLSAAIALVGSALIAQICISILAQDVRIPDPGLGSVFAQPAVGQVAFAVLASFCLAGFVVKKTLNADYIWSAMASALVTAFAVTIHLKEDILQHLVGSYPVVFFSNSVISILPVQIVAFGTLGSIAGYWLAIRYVYWRKHG